MVAFYAWVPTARAAVVWGARDRVNDGARLCGNSSCDCKAQLMGVADDISSGMGGGVGVSLRRGSGFEA